MDWHRPLLDVPGDRICAAGSKPITARWVEDPTNTDTSYTRNRIRAQLLPVLEPVFPQFRDTFARSSAHAAHAKQLQQDLAQADLQVVGVPPNIQALQQLSAERQANRSAPLAAAPSPNHPPVRHSSRSC